MKKAVLHIRPLRDAFLLYLILAVLACGAMFLHGNGWAAFLVTAVLFFRHSIFWSVYPDRMVQRIAGIPVRTIHFPEVSGMIHRGARVGYRGRRMPPTLLVVQAPGTIAEVSESAMLPDFAVSIPLNADQEDQVVETMERLYGPITDGCAVFFHDDLPDE